MEYERVKVEIMVQQYGLFVALFRLIAVCSLTRGLQQSNYGLTFFDIVRSPLANGLSSEYGQ